MNSSKLTEPPAQNDTASLLCHSWEALPLTTNMMNVAVMICTIVNTKDI